jgi:hypothetical protein
MLMVLYVQDMHYPFWPTIMAYGGLRIMSQTSILIFFMFHASSRMPKSLLHPHHSYYLILHASGHMPRALYSSHATCNMSHTSWLLGHALSASCFRSIASWPHVSCLLPHASCIMPYASLTPALCLMPHCLLPHASWLMSMTHDSCLMPHASCLMPRASCLMPHTSWLMSHASWCSSNWE